MDAALSHLRIIDLTHYVTGPYCTKLFADLGAEVIKVERPDGGDPARHAGPFPDDIPHPEKSGVFLHLNTNKKSITLNLKTESGKNILKELVKDADLLVESFSPQVMPSLGLSYEDLEKVNPRLVMTSITTFGQTGPYRDYKSNEEIIAYALGGTMYGTGMPDREPQKLGPTSIQCQAGNVAAVATSGALYGAMQSGVGQQVDVAIMEIQAGGQDRGGNGLATLAFSGGIGNVRATSSRSMTMPMGNWPCADGYVHFGIYRLHWWPRFCKMLGRPDWINHPQYSTPVGLRNIAEYGPEIDAVLLEWLMERTMQQVQEEGQAVGIAVTAVKTVEDVFADPHLAARDYWVQVDHPVVGTLTYPGAPAKYSQSPWQAGRAPLLGEHNEEIYCGRLGYTKQELVLLRQRGII